MPRGVFPLLLACLLPAPAQRLADFTTPRPQPPGSTLVVGFLGGWEAWDTPNRNVRRFALRLRARNLPGVHVETAGNHRRGLVLNVVRDAFDRDRDGQLSPAEAASARLILYGQSFGGAAVVKLARELNALNLPVLLTVQIDSVGRGDHLIPPNVRAAVNLYQRDPGLIRGQPFISAEDPAKTRILMNRRFSYSWLRPPWSHRHMDEDPAVWAIVEQAVLDALP